MNHHDEAAAHAAQCEAEAEAEAQAQADQAEAEREQYAAPQLHGLKLIPHRAIKKKGRCIRMGADTLLVNPDDYKQIARGNEVGQRRLERMRVTHQLPEYPPLKFEPLPVRFLENDRFEARYGMFWNVAAWGK